MKHSIKLQIARTFTGVIAAALLLCWLVNNFFLEDYYVMKKAEAIEEAYGKLNDAAVNSGFTDETFISEFDTMLSNNNISILVIDNSGKVKMYSIKDVTWMKDKLYSYIFDRENEGDTLKNLEENGNYVLRQRQDPIKQADYIEMIGMLDNGYAFIMQTALESIRESVSISNRFFAYIGVLTVCVSAIVTWILSKKITDPVLELTHISERMIHLDFDARYISKKKNEIDLLGEYMNQLANKLENTISELKRANNELMKDIEQKEQIDEMRKEFLSNVSHELKTPIALIQGYAEGLKENVNDDMESRDFYCEVIMDEAGKMNNMVKKLLDLNQLEFGHDVITMERFDIVTLIRNILQSSSILLQQKEIRVIFKATEPVYVWADEFKIEEVVTNYISNAMNHIAGERILEVRVEQQADTVRVSVFNTGDTIPEEDLDKIWTKFYKVDKARTREYGGSGIGLSIVKAIMDSLNKKCGVQNFTNGVEFWFELDSKVS